MNAPALNPGPATYPATGTRVPHQVDEQITELLANASIEMTAREAPALASAAADLPAGRSIYVPSLPGQPLDRALDALRAIHALGFDPVPHVAARRIGSRAVLAAFLQEAVQQCGVHRVMLIGGDEAAPAGPFADSLAVLRAGVLAHAGIREVGLAAYPEGHPKIGAEALRTAFETKLALATDQGLGVHVVTQFSFAPDRIVALCGELAHRAPQVPVYVGMAGPTDPLALMRYAQRCGVSASRRALRTLGTSIAKLVTHTDPGEQLAALAHYCLVHAPDTNVVGVHLFSFGGLARTARWVRAEMNERA